MSKTDEIRLCIRNCETCGLCLEASANDERRKRKPQTVLCFICGREFGPSSVFAHEKQCAKRWKMIEDAKPVFARRPLPSMPAAPREDGNYQAWNKAVKAGLQSFQMYSAGGSADGITLQTLPYQPGSRMISESSPNTGLLSSCCMCGELFGSASIKIHERLCMKSKELHSAEIGNIQGQAC